MSQIIEAVFENGVLRPLENLALRPNQRVVLRIDEEVADEVSFKDYCRAEGDPTISLDTVRRALAKIPGTMTQACIDERDED